MEDWKAPERALHGPEDANENIVSTLNSIAEKLESFEFIYKGLSLPDLTEILSPISRLIKNQDFINVDLPNQIHAVLENNAAYERILFSLSIYLDLSIISSQLPKRAADERLRSLRGDALTLLQLAKQIFASTGQSPDWKESTFFAAYEDERTIEEYRVLLFSDIPEEDFDDYLKNAAPGNWLDVGSGNTYRNPDSLISKLVTLNPNVTLVGIDPLYSDTHARPYDVLHKRSDVDADSLNKHNLVPGTGQRLPFEKNTFKKVLIAHVLTWMDKINQVDQIIRQAARVLAPEGELRANSVAAQVFEDKNNVLHEYFNITHSAREESTWRTDDGEVKKHYAYKIVATKKILNARQKLALQRDIDTWLSTYPK